ncbi:MAG: beta-ketoacyl-ACP synthase III [Alkalispirochaeta sp.]
MPALISAVASYAPDRIVTNEELARTIDTSDEWIRSHTGIRERRIASEDQAASDLALRAAQRALARVGAAGTDLDMIIVASSSPDYANFPSVASIVQDRIGASQAGAFDLAAGCTGFVYALEVARSLVEAGSAGKVMVIGSEVLTRITNWEDRNTCVLFGDGAGAALVESGPAGGSAPTGATPREADPSPAAPAPREADLSPAAPAPREASPRHELLGSWLQSKGSGDAALIRPVGGTRTPYDAQRHTAADMTIHMDGRRVYLFAVDALVRSIETLCERHGLTSHDLAWIVPHQANARIIEAAAKRIGLPLERFYTNLDRYANTSAASIPLALDEMQEQGLLKQGQMVLTVGFGAGLSYGGNMIRW